MSNISICTKCGLEQMETEFRVIRILKDGTERRRRDCKTCERMQKHQRDMKKKLERESVSNEIIGPMLNSTIDEIYLCKNDPSQIERAIELSDTLKYLSNIRRYELMATPTNSFEIPYPKFDNRFPNLDRKNELQGCKNFVRQTLVAADILCNPAIGTVVDLNKIHICEKKTSFLVVIENLELTEPHFEFISFYIENL